MVGGGRVWVGANVAVAVARAVAVAVDVGRLEVGFGVGEAAWIDVTGIANACPTIRVLSRILLRLRMVQIEIPKRTLKE